MVMNTCKRLIDTVLNVFRTNTSHLTETVTPVVTKAKERVQETMIEAEVIAQELKVSAEHQVAAAYDKAVNVGHQAAELLEGSKEHLEEVMEEIKTSSEQIVAGVKGQTFKAKAAAAKAPASKTRKTAATAKTRKPATRKTSKPKSE